METKLVEVDCENCIHDYKCCASFHITLTIEEAESGLYKFKRKSRLYENNQLIGYIWTIPSQEDGFCIYFDKITRKCSIHDYKPSACKLWNQCQEGKWPKK